MRLINKDNLAFEDTSQKSREWYEEGKVAWLLASDDVRAAWEAESRERVTRQPYIKDAIIESFRRNPSKSFEKVAEEIGNWCSPTAIKMWMKRQKCRFYVGKVLPLLSKIQMQKHVEFATQVLARWGLPPLKYLWIHYDEKWFWGLVLRSSEILCEMLGIDKQQHYVYHQNHINKVMAIAFTAYALMEILKMGVME